MNEQTTEWISALADDEAEARDHRRIKELLDDAELMQRWADYHLISDCMKQRLPERLDTALAARVCQALREEPTIVSLHSFRRVLLKPAGGFAIAASVAAVAILGLQEQPDAVYRQTAPAPLVQTAPESIVGPRATDAPVRQVGGQVTGSMARPADCARPADVEEELGPATSELPEATAEVCR